MKLTKSKLKQLIKEELRKVLHEAAPPPEEAEEEAAAAEAFEKEQEERRKEFKAKREREKLAKKQARAAGVKRASSSNPSSSEYAHPEAGGRVIPRSMNPNLIGGAFGRGWKGVKFVNSTMDKDICYNIVDKHLIYNVGREEYLITNVKFYGVQPSCGLTLKIDPGDEKGLASWGGEGVADSDYPVLIWKRRYKRLNFKVAVQQAYESVAPHLNPGGPCSTLRCCHISCVINNISRAILRHGHYIGRQYYDVSVYPPEKENFDPKSEYYYGKNLAYIVKYVEAAEKAADPTL
jgi:hypothetical protein